MSTEKIANANKSAAEGVLDRLLSAYGIDKKRGWQAELAEKTGVAPNVVSGWKGRGVPERIIAKATIETGRSLEWIILGGVDKQYPGVDAQGEIPIVAESGHSPAARRGLRPDQAELLLHYEHLCEDQRNVVLMMVKGFAEELRRSGKSDNQGGGSQASSCG